MARIRTIKPEAFYSETLATLSLTAERTFFGLFTQADDEGRFRDNPAIIAGLLWPLRQEHTPVEVERDLGDLHGAGVICRYTGCDGKRYLHITGWAEHQKISKATPSRTPTCPQHHARARCAGCSAVPCRVVTGGALSSDADQSAVRAVRVATAPGDGREDSGTAPGLFPEGSCGTGSADEAMPGRVSDAKAGEGAHTGSNSLAEERVRHVLPDQRVVKEPSRSVPGGLPESSGAGSWTVDRGSSAPSERTPLAMATTRTLLEEHLGQLAHQPPKRTRGHLAAAIGALLGEGIDADHVRAGLDRMRRKALGPSLLPDLVSEAMNPAPHGSTPRDRRAGVAGHQGWANPADPVTAYGEEL